MIPLTSLLLKMSKVLVVFPALVYLVIALLTISDYGINWDEPFHFQRGQAYLRYFFTGKRNYDGVPTRPPLKGSSDFVWREGEPKGASASFHSSYYQSDYYNFERIIEMDGGHPPVNGILASLSNYIFYQKLGILGDIESYHLFEIAVSFFLVAGVSIFVYQRFGLLASLVSGISLASYPLFFSESHFNIKDPVETSFFGLSLITFYFGVIRRKWWFILSSSILFGFALGTKFNALFLIPMLGAWLIFKRSTKLVSVLFPYLIIGFLVLYLFWPYLWINPVGNLLEVFKYYWGIGTTRLSELDKYVHWGINIFPSYWIAITTQVPILALALAGLGVSAYKTFKEKSDVHFLILLWFLLPILRVSSSATAINGGVRQIMEFVPAMAILAGIGASSLRNKILVGIVFLALGFSVLEIAKIHPNENIYFNQLIGGLKGAEEKDVRYWGYSYGNVYLQGVNWLNANAPKDSKIALAVANMINVPRIKMRADLDFSNDYLSGPFMAGEYVMEMSHDWQQKKWYSYAYYDKNLRPVYEAKVDGVAILKIWKNDKERLFRPQIGDLSLKIRDLRIKDGVLTVDLNKIIALDRIEILHDRDDCEKQRGGYIRVSSDGKIYDQESETPDHPQIPKRWSGWGDNKFVWYFNGKEIISIFFDTQMGSSCILKNPEIRIYGRGITNNYN